MFRGETAYVFFLQTLGWIGILVAKSAATVQIQTESHAGNFLLSD